MSETSIKRAVLYSLTKPDSVQEERFKAFLEKKYGHEVELVWEKSNAFPGGFRLEAGTQVYDWSVNGRFQQLKETLVNVPAKNGNVMPLIRETVKGWTPKVLAQEVGTVLTVGDGIATVSGLDNVKYGEILLFTSGVRGMVQELGKEHIGCILFDDNEDVCEGTTVRRTGKTAGIPVSDDFKGRVLNALGVPVDDKGDIEPAGYREIEHPAPGIIDRQPVDTPMETGILAIDAIFPIGRGQRELIIGDRQTGKTTIALDTIINQKGKDVICIYVAIGQKASSVAQLVNTLKKHGAMDYTIVVTASAGEAAPLQYIAPYSGCAIGEYFMDQGKDVLIVYDDLSKHAVAYRTLSLLLERPPGREAYPGDVFYLHSRLLERSAHMSDEKGGGSITALPIVETQAGDVSAYIPTNIISITDGQIFLESDLFFAGQRPAVNVGLSVSRVGGDAQTKAMKKAAGALRLDLAQYREMEVFTQFASDLDEMTRNQLKYGQGLMRVLRQPQAHPWKHHQQVILLVACLAHLLQNVNINHIGTVAVQLVEKVEQECFEVCERINETGKLSDEDKQAIIESARKFISERLNG